MAFPPDDPPQLRAAAAAVNRLRAVASSGPGVEGIVVLRMPIMALAATLAGATLPAVAEPPLDDAVRFGAVATLAPLCTLRDAAWAADLRRALLQAAPGSNLAAAALSYAESEALEDFAAGPADATCGPLAHDLDLDRADAIVREFRRRGPGS
jgi:hypothetical protein